MKHTKGWIVLHDACNLCCELNYAKGTGYDASKTMDIATAHTFIDSCAALKLKHLTLIEDEPTIYPHLIGYSSAYNTFIPY